MGSATLNHAKDAKKDDFWTRLEDIEAECSHYRKQFFGKTIICNCDDPKASNFVRYFALNFKAFGLKRLISTCYKNAQGNLFSTGADERACYFDYDGTEGFNSVEELVKLKKVDMPEMCDGDFRHPFCVDLLKQADIVVTNPPFSLFREYIALLIQSKKKFLVLGNQNNVTYADVFPLFMQNLIWLGYKTGDMAFRVPADTEPRATRYWQDETGQKWRSLGNICWFTNLDIPKRHETLPLFQTYSPEVFPKYDNFDAIEIGKVANIPKDYAGLMGVPLTFLDKHNPEQFEIVGDDISLRVSKGRFYLNGRRLYSRLVIRHKHPEKSK